MINLRLNNERYHLPIFLAMLWLLPLVVMASCSGPPPVKDISVEPADVAKSEEQEKAPDFYRYMLGPRDEFTVSVWRHDDLIRKLQIDPSGNIQYPLVGEIRASGLTISQLREELTGRLSRYLVDPQVDISVSNLKNLRLYVLGEVKVPGTYEWRKGMSAWEGISLAGGFNTDADQENILLVRSEYSRTVIKAVNLKSILSGEHLVQDIYLQNSDVVYVLPTAIVDVQRFMTRLYNILSPLIAIESAIVLFPEARDILLGKENSQTGVIVPR